MSKNRKRLIPVDFLHIENGTHLSHFETSVREMLSTRRDWDKLFFWMDLDDALKTLTEKQRVCFSLKYIGGFSETEICGLLRMSQPMVFKHIRAAIEKIKYFLSDGYKTP